VAYDALCAVLAADIGYIVRNRLHYYPFFKILSITLILLYIIVIYHHNDFLRGIQFSTSYRRHMELNAIKGFLLDMDGTFYLENTLLKGALEFLKFLNSQHLPFTFLTNNSSRSATNYREKLVKLGVHQDDARVLTSGDATISYLASRTSYKRIFLAATQSLVNDFTQAGFVFDNDQPELVVLTYDTTITYSKLVQICNFVRAGLPFIATHPDINCPMHDGFVPDIGSFLALIKASTGRDPDLVIGKPNIVMAQTAADILGLPLDQLAMIGDRLYTDIAMGTTAGLTTILVLTGETKKNDLDASPYKPDYVFENLSSLLSTLYIS
jgi:HAD superfamily hydrolase (TIGR01457 family)